MQDCSISIVLAMEILQFCTKPSTYRDWYLLVFALYEITNSVWGAEFDNFKEIDYC